MTSTSFSSLTRISTIYLLIAASEFVNGRIIGWTRDELIAHREEPGRWDPLAYHPNDEIHLPSDAIAVGIDHADTGQELYVCRAPVNGRLLVGRLSPLERTCFVPVADRYHADGERWQEAPVQAGIEVLRSEGNVVEWRPHKRGPGSEHVPDGAVMASDAMDAVDGYPQFVCRATHNLHRGGVKVTLPGRVSSNPSAVDCCVTSYWGGVQCNEIYQILTEK